MGTHRIRRDKSNPNGRIGKVKVKSDSNGRDVVVSNNTGTKVVISPTGQNNNEGSSWRVIEYHFTRNYIRHSLYPVIAWKRDANGNRSFLTQKEAIPYVAKLSLPEGGQGDVKLGEIAVGYFSRDIIKKWPASMALKPLEGAKPSPRGDDFKQPMSGGQMPAWVAVEGHQAELLRSENSVMAVLERNLSLYQ